MKFCAVNTVQPPAFPIPAHWGYESDCSLVTKYGTSLLSAGTWDTIENGETLGDDASGDVSEYIISDNTIKVVYPNADYEVYERVDDNHIIITEAVYDGKPEKIEDIDRHSYRCTQDEVIEKI